MILFAVGRGKRAFLEEIKKGFEESINKRDEEKLNNDDPSGVELIKITGNKDIDYIIKRLKENPNDFITGNEDINCMIKKLEENPNNGFDMIDEYFLEEETNSVSYPFNKYIHNQNTKVKSKFCYQKTKNYHNTKIK